MENSLISTISEMIKSKEIQCLVLDFDGVITDLGIEWKNVIRRISSAMGREIDSLLRLYREEFGKESFAKVSAIAETFELEAIKRAPLCLTIAKIIEVCRINGVRVYIASYQSKNVVDIFLKKHSLESLVEDVLTRDQFPDKATALRYLFEKRLCSVERTLFIDDSERNLREVKMLGAKTLRFKCEDFDSKLRIYV